MPKTRLILRQKGDPFELSVKRRVNFEGEAVEYLAADSLKVTSPVCIGLLASEPASAATQAAGRVQRG
ncbi:hypothetical protein BCO71171_00397 [Burkholderia contaminans]|uniref:Uncharacterized protein n=1 Tax=Burkholderia contaminans TaxID=488447 RepID=A0A6P2V8V0_9BURK|nr:hypothetical protein BCO71171_00397 [Burkholderia contaminans]